MRSHSLLSNLCFAAVAAFVAGCGLEPETLDSLRGMVQAASVAAAATPPLEAPAGEPIRFDPPHPDRINPFTFPEGQSLAADLPSPAVVSSVQVDVLGFAQVDEPRVFLRSGDVTKSLAVGDMIDGTRVIGIHPPAVDLQRGGLRWRATLFGSQDSP